MAAAQSTIRYSHHDQALTFRVEGRATMTQSVPMRQCAERLSARGTKSVKVDLRDCSYMDSTFLGTLLSLKKAQDKQNGTFALIAPSDACQRILAQMGLQDMLLRDPADLDPNITWSDLPAEPADPNSFKRTVTQAHEELARLPGPAGEQFAEVMRCLSKPDKPAE